MEFRYPGQRGRRRPAEACFCPEIVWFQFDVRVYLFCYFVRSALINRIWDIRTVNNWMLNEIQKKSGNRRTLIEPMHFQNFKTRKRNEFLFDTCNINYKSIRNQTIVFLTVCREKNYNIHKNWFGLWYLFKFYWNSRIIRDKFGNRSWSESYFVLAFMKMIELNSRFYSIKCASEFEPS